MRVRLRHGVRKYENVKVNQVINNPFGVSNTGRVKAEGGGSCSVRTGVYIDGDSTKTSDFEEVKLDSGKNLEDAVAYFGQPYNYLKVVQVSGTVHLVVQNGIVS